MGHGHAHGHSCGHGHHHGDAKIGWAVGFNIVLTFAQLVGGVLAGSLALIADALHNFSDAGALLLALVARRIARRGPDEKRSYGYMKVETLAAFTNFLVLILVAFWLGIEAVTRFFDPRAVEGGIVFVLAGIGFAINAGTALLVRAQARGNQNIRAAYLHSVTDAVSSLGVMLAGIAIHYMGWTWLDPLITLAISAYIVLHALKDFPDIVNILIDGKAAEMRTSEIAETIRNIDGVGDIHHIHMRQLGEGRHALEAHVVLTAEAEMDRTKRQIKERLRDRNIGHSTIEFESEACAQSGCAPGC
jgi:cobalt-zinc-cadmium efflux system protein